MTLPNGNPRVHWLPYDFLSPFVGPQEWTIDDETGFDVPIGLPTFDPVLDDPNPPLTEEEALVRPPHEPSREELFTRGENLLREDIERAISRARAQARVHIPSTATARAAASYRATVREARLRRRAEIAASFPPRPPLHRPGATRPIRGLERRREERRRAAQQHEQDEGRDDDASGSGTRSSSAGSEVARGEGDDDDDEEKEDEDEDEEDGEEDDEDDDEEDSEKDKDEDDEDEDRDEDDNEDDNGDEGDGDGHDMDHQLGCSTDEEEESDDDDMSPWEREAWRYILYVISVNRNLTWPELVEYNQVFLRDDYREQIVERATADSHLSVMWTPTAHVPENLFELVGPGLRYFARAHAYPPYISTRRLDHMMVASRAPIIDGNREPRRIIVGPTIIDLVSNLDAPALAATTAGSLVAPVVGRTYAFEDVYPRPGQAFDDARAPRAADADDDRSTPSYVSSTRSSSPGASTRSTSHDSETVIGTPPVPINRNWKVGQRTQRPDGTWSAPYRDRTRIDADQPSDDMDTDSDEDEISEEVDDGNDASDEGDGEDDCSDESDMDISSAESEEPTYRRRLSTIDLTDEQDDCAPAPSRRMSTIELNSAEDDCAPASSRRLSTIELSSDDGDREPASSSGMSIVELSDDDNNRSGAPALPRAVIDLTGDDETRPPVIDLTRLSETQDDHVQSNGAYVSSDEMRSEEEERERNAADARDGSRSSSEMDHDGERVLAIARYFEQPDTWSD
ncbi:hypothetical protein K525DRAFT_273922 [Schizophyllum commune Loenen D]|nr:hypothetical protein K525DRAFT_273922 [Schizophyllum commune Loenen D]